MSSRHCPRGATWIGAGALFLWVIEPLVVSELEGFPLFEALTLVFVSCFCLTAARVTLAGRWRDILAQPLFVWSFALIAICGSDFCYMLGAFSAPIAHVDLIDYMWPFLIVLFIGFLPGETFSLRHFIGGALGFAGVFELLSHGQGMQGFNPDYMLGYCLAVFGVMVWGAYSTFVRLRPTIPSDMVGIVCGIGALITGSLHLSLETTVTPSLTQGGLAVLLGLAGPGLAYQLWDVGMKFGNARGLSVACYLARVAGTALLVVFGKEPFSQPLVLACALACLGMLISSVSLTQYKLGWAWLRDLGSLEWGRNSKAARKSAPLY